VLHPKTSSAKISHMPLHAERIGVPPIVMCQHADMARLPPPKGATYCTRSAAWLGRRFRAAPTAAKAAGAPRPQPAPRRCVLDAQAALPPAPCQHTRCENSWLQVATCSLPRIPLRSSKAHCTMVLGPGETGPVTSVVQGCSRESKLCTTAKSGIHLLRGRLRRAVHRMAVEA